MLHSLLEKQKESVDFFVLYSSITSIIGNSGQTSYSAANGFLNSFADYRAEVLKKPCLAVCWGAMGGAGMLQDNAKLATLLEETGLHLLDINRGKVLRFFNLIAFYRNVDVINGFKIKYVLERLILAS